MLAELVLPVHNGREMTSRLERGGNLAYELPGSPIIADLRARVLLLFYQNIRDACTRRQVFFLQFQLTKPSS